MTLARDPQKVVKIEGMYYRTFVKEHHKPEE
jgi:hypothetical protein